MFRGHADVARDLAVLRKRVGTPPQGQMVHLGLGLGRREAGVVPLDTH